MWPPSNKSDPVSIGLSVISKLDVNVSLLNLCCVLVSCVPYSVTKKVLNFLTKSLIESLYTSIYHKLI